MDEKLDGRRPRPLRAAGLLVYPEPGRQTSPCFTNLTVTNGRGAYTSADYCWDDGYGEEWREGQLDEVEEWFGCEAAEEVGAALGGWNEWMGYVQSKLGGLLGLEDLTRAAWDSWEPVRPDGWEGLCAVAAPGLEDALKAALDGPGARAAAAPLALRALRGLALREAAVMEGRESVSREDLARLAAKEGARALAAAEGAAAGPRGLGEGASAQEPQAAQAAAPRAADPFSARPALRAGGLELAHWRPAESGGAGWEYVAVRREGRDWGPDECLLIDYAVGELALDSLAGTRLGLTDDEREAVEDAMGDWPARAEEAATGLGALVGLQAAMAAAWDSWEPVREPGWRGLCAQAAMALPDAMEGRAGDVARTATPCAVASAALDWLKGLAGNIVPGEDGAPALDGLAARDLADAAVVRAMADIDWSNERFIENALEDLAGLQGDLDRAAAPAGPSLRESAGAALGALRAPRGAAAGGLGR